MRDSCARSILPEAEEAGRLVCFRALLRQKAFKGIPQTKALRMLKTCRKVMEHHHQKLLHSVGRLRDQVDKERHPSGKRRKHGATVLLAACSELNLTRNRHAAEKSRQALRTSFHHGQDHSKNMRKSKKSMHDGQRQRMLRT